MQIHTSLLDKDPRENRAQLTGALVLAFLGGFVGTELVFHLIFG